ncbi:Membrane-bound lytic murein transglycosylase B precursor [Tsuneonella dongtanensis]|uniref:Membrane-bound lytic murein transglycosylase B n=1 Tax=Tsuneonella dongtanensis TaxID=692370 RepID=A0A1B2AEW2_9SPHN|nr:lytic murein transglycosylase [Tsuneonella dongtanensis]ANY20651.1 Membrane-bound lytic murein transglycosylase B precursor [Tsuneonella dongtanensis]
MRLKLFAFLVALLATPVSAQEMSFDAYLQLLIARARAEGVSEPTIQRMTYDLTPNSRVIELDRAQPGTPSSSGEFPRLQSYLDRHVDAARINGGRRNYQALGPLASQLETRYGVPAKMLVAIWGHETNYGSYTGDFDLARSLATLAWEGRRRELFATEFVDLLKIADLGVTRQTLKGSWAGAFGYPQFLPSIYLRLAQDGDGDGRRDIWNSRADTLASIANYFRDAGWRRGQPWGVQASVPGGLDWNALKSPMNSPVCSRVHDRHSKWMSVAEWKRLGVQPLVYLDDNVTASLFQPDGPGTRAWLLTANYRVILEYNCSNYYAMSVGLLADEIVR